MEKILLIIFDGIGDRPVSQLEHKTPLQYAKKPNFNKLATRGICGFMDPIAPGIRPGSDTAHLAILGYDPYRLYTGRGPFEAAGIGMDLLPGDVAFRCNFSTVDENFKVIDRRAGRISEGAEELAKLLDNMEIDGIKCLFKAGIEHRCVLVLRGDNLSDKVSDIDPHTEGAYVKNAKPLSKDGEITANVLTKFVKESYKILNDHTINRERVRAGLNPANIVLPRGGGFVPHIEKFDERYKLKSCCVVGIPLVKGICKFVGMSIIDVKGSTGGINTNLSGKSDAVVDALGKYDFVFLHVKAPDVYSHDHDAYGKVKFIERLDREVLQHLIKNIDFGTTLVVLTSDHSTPVSVSDHTADPVPISITSNSVRKDNVKKFDEISVTSGGLGRVKGLDLLNIVMDLTNRSEKFGA